MVSKDHPDIDLHLLLGKVLKDGEISVEFGWRIWSFFHNLYFEQKGNNGEKRVRVAVLSGYGGEAYAAAERLQQLQHLLNQPTLKGYIGPAGHGMMYMETQAPNSRLNIQYAVKKVRDQGHWGKIRLYLHSSDYHVSALKGLHRLLPDVSPFSYVDSGETCRFGEEDVVTCPAPYLFPDCGIAEIEWLAEVYKIRQGLRLPWENIRGISGVPGKEEPSKKERRKLGIFVKPGTVEEFLEESLNRVKASIKQFRVLLKKVPKTRNKDLRKRIKRAKKDINSFITLVGRHLPWLKKHCGATSAVRSKLAKWQAVAKELEPVINPTHIGDIDPDTAGSKWEYLIR